MPGLFLCFFPRLFLWLFLWLWPFAAKAAETWIKARVVGSNALVYKEADFDSRQLGQYRVGVVVVVSTQSKGAFYPVKIREGVVGFISDVDVVPLKGASPELPNAVSGTAAPATSRGGASRAKGGAQVGASSVGGAAATGVTSAARGGSVGTSAAAEAPRPPRPIHSVEKTDFWGIELASIRFREDTMGMRPSTAMTFLGYKATGPHIVVNGMNTTFNALISLGPPRYYEQATGNSADGFILFLDFLMEYTVPATRNTMSFFGFGPLYKYSKFDVTLANVLVNGKFINQSYSLEDMTLGAIFNAGLSHRLTPRFALRLEFEYYWEKLQYYGFSLTTQFAF
ncbi:MAG: hypothetical protein C5B49_01845 [Bdellovibrio sp.]|nr:MAG: hypothetical protein C5B49_01845 [Bdellovibrio sp.]